MRSSLSMRLVPLAATGVATLAMTLAPSPASAFLFTFDDPVAVDEGDVAIGTHAGTAMTRLDGTWHLVYVRDGELQHVQGDGASWSAPDAIDGPGSVIGSSVHLSRDVTGLWLTYQVADDADEDVFLRRFADGDWQDEMNATFDRDAASTPVVTGLHADGEEPRARLAWVEAGRATRTVLTREWRDGQWQAVDVVSGVSTDAHAPSVSGERFSGLASVAWLDEGDEIPAVLVQSYQDGAPAFDPVEVQAFPGLGGPSIQTLFCCGDLLMEGHATAYTLDPTLDGETDAVLFSYPDGSTEPLGGYQDGSPGTDPGVTAFLTPVPGGVRNVIVAAWSEDAAPGPGRRVHLYAEGEETILAEDVLSHPLVASAAANRPEETLDQLLVCWIELREGTPTLVTAFGTASTAVSVGGASSAPAVPSISAAPNPFATSTVLALGDDAAGGDAGSSAGAAVRVRIWDATGRQVRDLGAVRGSEVTWDGRDDAGRAVAPGVYFVRAQAPDVTRTVRVQRVR